MSQAEVFWACVSFMFLVLAVNVSGQIGGDR